MPVSVMAPGSRTRRTRSTDERPPGGHRSDPRHPGAGPPPTLGACPHGRWSSPPAPRPGSGCCGTPVSTPRWWSAGWTRTTSPPTTPPPWWPSWPSGRPGPWPTGSGEAVVVGCDSMLEFDGRPHGKPSSADQAREWLRSMRGRIGTLFTGHCVIDGATGRRATGVAGTTVRFGVTTDAELDAYLATGEALAVAGAFTLDGRSAPFIDGVDGDPGNVIGLSLPLLRSLLAELDIAITDLWVGRRADRAELPTAPMPALKLGTIAVDPPVVLAPMAGVTNVAFRRLCRTLRCRPLRERDDHRPRPGRGQRQDPGHGRLRRRRAGAQRAAVRCRPRGDGRRRAPPGGRDRRRPHRPQLRLPGRQGHPAGRPGPPCPSTGPCSGPSSAPRWARPDRSRSPSSCASGSTTTTSPSSSPGRIAEDEGVAAVTLHARTAEQLYSGHGRLAGHRRAQGGGDLHPGAGQRRPVGGVRRPGHGGRHRLRRRGGGTGLPRPPLALPGPGRRLRRAGGPAPARHWARSSP